MKEDEIAEIGIKDKCFYIKPLAQKFPHIYRECMGVKWDPNHEILSMGEHEVWDWDFLKCFQQIFSAAREQGYHLLITPRTNWINITEQLKGQILFSSSELILKSHEHEAWAKANQAQIIQGGLKAEKQYETLRAWESAQDAFRNKGFAGFVSILSPYVDHLTSVQLQKFRYAQKKMS